MFVAVTYFVMINSASFTQWITKIPHRNDIW